jgi:hypothetical protein
MLALGEPFRWLGLPLEDLRAVKGCLEKFISPWSYQDLWFLFSRLLLVRYQSPAFVF